MPRFPNMKTDRDKQQAWYDNWLKTKGYDKDDEGNQIEPIGDKFKTHMERCPRCEEVMLDVQTCHLLCPRCGGHMDCSDKGAVW